MPLLAVTYDVWRNEVRLAGLANGRGRRGPLTRRLRRLVCRRRRAQTRDALSMRDGTT
jgi:hypothetical protein